MDLPDTHFISMWIPRELNPQFFASAMFYQLSMCVYLPTYLLCLQHSVLVCINALPFHGTAGLKIWNVNPCDPLGGFQGPPSIEWIGIGISSNQSHQGNIWVSVAAGFELLSTWQENILLQIKQLRQGLFTFCAATQEWRITVDFHNARVAGLCLCCITLALFAVCIYS